MVSYEVSMGLVIINVLLCAGSLDLLDIVEAQRDMWFALPLLPMFVVFSFQRLLRQTVLPLTYRKGVRTRCRLFCGIFVNIICAFLPRGVCQYDFDE